MRGKLDSKGQIKVSCAIFTLNEESNLPKCLQSLAWCDDVVVIDSYSTDRTPEIAQTSGARFFQHPFTGFGDQRNWALETISFKNEWILILDADEAVTPELVAEMRTRLPQIGAEVAAFRIKRKFYLWGKWLKHSSLYPTWVIRMVRKGRVRYVNRGHAETQVVEGKIEAFDADLRDENLKGIEDWFARQNRYSTKEALHELSQPNPPVSQLFSRDPLLRREAVKSMARRAPLRPVLFFLFNYFWRKGFLDGVAGFRFSVMKAIYTEMIVLKRYEITRHPELYRQGGADTEKKTRQSSNET